MKRVYKIEVDCALCASKIQEAIKKVDGVNFCTVNYMTQKMILDIDDDKYEEVYKKAIKVAKRVESDFEVLE